MEYTILRYTAPSKKFKNNYQRSLKYKILGEEEEELPRSEVFSKDFLNISHENALFLILEDSIWLQFIYFMTKIVF